MIQKKYSKLLFLCGWSHILSECNQSPPDTIIRWLLFKLGTKHVMCFDHDKTYINCLWSFSFSLNPVAMTFVLASNYWDIWASNPTSTNHSFYHKLQQCSAKTICMSVTRNQNQMTGLKNSDVMLIPYFKNMKYVCSEIWINRPTCWTTVLV